MIPLTLMRKQIVSPGINQASRALMIPLTNPGFSVNQLSPQVFAGGNICVGLSADVMFDSSLLIPDYYSQDTPRAKVPIPFFTSGNGSNFAPLFFDGVGAISWSAASQVYAFPSPELGTPIPYYYGPNFIGKDLSNGHIFHHLAYNPGNGIGYPGETPVIPGGPGWRGLYVGVWWAWTITAPGANPGDLYHGMTFAGSAAPCDTTLLIPWG